MLERMWQYLTSVQGIPVLGVAILSLVYLLRGRNDKRPPFPWFRFPILGNMIALSISKDRCCELFYKTSKKPEYEGVFMIKLGGREFCIVNNIDLVREALIHKAEHFANRPTFFTFEMMTANKDIIFSKYGPEWRLQRKIVHQAFRAFASGNKLNDAVHSTTTQVIKLLKQEKGSFFVKPFLELIQFNIFTNILFGKSYALDDPEFTKFNNFTSEGFATIGNGTVADIFPYLSWLPFQGRCIEKFMNKFLDTLKKEYYEHKETFNPDHLRDLTDFLIMTQKQIEEEDPDHKGLVDDEHLIYSLFDVFGAGIDTINAVLMFSVGNAILNPECQDKIRSEVLENIGERLPVSSDREKLPYTEAYLCEVMRHDALTSLGIPLMTTCDTTIGKYKLPQDTSVIMNFWAVHNDPDHWDAPSEFKPERFLEKDGNLAQRPISFMPFSAGKRGCLGEALSKSMLMVVLPMLFTHLKFTKPDNFCYEFENTGIGHIVKTFKVGVEARE